MTDGPDTATLLGHLAEVRGLDLRDYRRETIAEGLRRRLAATAAPDVAAYVNRLDQDPAEIDRLLAAVVVPHTGFYRDPEVWGALADVVLPRFLAGPAAGLRAWCVGAATGEEAWTLAMLLRERCPAGDPRFDLLASDREPGAVAAAAAGRYPARSAADLPERLRRRYLLAAGDEVRVVDDLRARVRFARHDLMGPALAPPEAVVASFDLVLLRNVLIYFGRPLQEKALDRVTAVLEPGGALVLGHVETLPERHARGYEPFPGTSPHLRVYRRVAP